MDLRGVIIGAIVVGIIVSAFAIVIGEYNTAYGTTIGTGFNDTFNKIDDVRVLSEEMSDAIETSTVSVGSFLGFMATGAWKVLVMMITTPITLMTSLITDMTAQIGFPAWFGGALVTILVVTVVFIIVGTIFRRRI